MRIGIDARMISGRWTGDRTYWRGLLGGLSELNGDDEFVLYLREPIVEPGDQLDLGTRFSWKTIASTSGRIWSLASMPAAARADRVDVVHVQYTVSPLLTMPVVTTVHDVSFRLFPELFNKKDRFLLNMSVPAAIRRAARVIAVSENTRRDILRAYSSPPEKVVAIPLAADSRFRPMDEHEKAAACEMLSGTYGLAGPYIVAVGVLQPRKNLPMLLQAFRRAKKIGGFAHRLAVVGKRGWMTEQIDAAVREAGDDIVLTGYVPDEHLPALYNCADIMCYPSLYEGFGLPPLEAMACGCPVVASRSSSLPEVIGPAGVLADPDAVGPWIDALLMLTADPSRRAALSSAGLARAAKFRWSRTAQETLTVYRACHNRHSKSETV